MPSWKFSWMPAGDRLRAGARAADVDLMRDIDGKGEQVPVQEYRTHHVEIRKMPGADAGIVADDGVARR